MSTRIAPEIKTEIYLPEIFKEQCTLALWPDQLAEILAPDFYALNNHFKQSILDSEDPIAQALYYLPPELKTTVLDAAINKHRQQQNLNVFQCLWQNLLLFFIYFFNFNLSQKVENKLKIQHKHLDANTLKTQVPFNQICRKVKAPDDDNLRSLLSESVSIAIQSDDGNTIWQLTKNDKTYAFSAKTGVIEITKDQSIVDPLPFLKKQDDYVFLSTLMIDEQGFYQEELIHQSKAAKPGPIIHITQETHAFMVQSLKALSGTPDADFFREAIQSSSRFIGFEDLDLHEKAEALLEPKGSIKKLFRPYATDRQLEAMMSPGYTLQTPLFLPIDYCTQAIGLQVITPSARHTSFIMTESGDISFKTEFGSDPAGTITDHHFDREYGFLTTSYAPIYSLILDNGFIIPGDPLLKPNPKSLILHKGATCTQTFYPDGSVDIDYHLNINHDALEFAQYFKKAFSIKTILETLKTGKYDTKAFMQLIQYGFKPSKTVLKETLKTVLNTILYHAHDLKNPRKLPSIKKSLYGPYRPVLSEAFSECLSTPPSAQLEPEKQKPATLELSSVENTRPL